MSIYQVPFDFDRKEFDAQYPILLSGRVSEPQWHSTIDRCNGVVRAYISRMHSARGLSVALGICGSVVVAVLILLFVSLATSLSGTVSSLFLIMPIAIALWGLMALASVLITTSASKSASKQCQERMAQVLEAEKALYMAQGVQFIYRQQNIRQHTAGYGGYGRPRRGHGLVLVPSLDVIITGHGHGHGHGYPSYQYHHHHQHQHQQQYPSYQYQHDDGQHQHQHQHQQHHNPADYYSGHMVPPPQNPDPHTAPYSYVPHYQQQQQQHPYSVDTAEDSKEPAQQRQQQQQHPYSVDTAEDSKEPAQQRQQQQQQQQSQGPVYYSGSNTHN